MKCDILIVGVGGQGVISTSNVVAQAAFESDFDVKKSETRGMSQQGGSVTSHIRVGEKVNTVLIPEGWADVLIALEPLEALRYMQYLSLDGKAVVNSQPLKIPGYPPITDVLAELEKQDALVVDALEIARQAGSHLTQNTVLVGVVSKYLPIKEEAILASIKKFFQKHVDENTKAFELGKNLE